MIPGFVRYWFLLKKAEMKYKYYKKMGKVRLKDLKPGDKLYKVNPVNGHLLYYTINKIDGSWFTIANDTGFVCASIQTHNIDSDNLNGEYYTNGFMAIWMAIRKIRDEQYRLEKKRIEIIKTNKVKVTINGEKEHWWNRFIKIKK